MNTTIRSQIDALKPAGTTLVKASNRGEQVWALECAHHERGVHRHTLTSGVACFAWAPTQIKLLRKIS